MSTDLGSIQVASLSVATEDAGEVTGIGIIFEREDFADQFIDQVEDYFETPGDQPRHLGIEFRDHGTSCDLLIDIFNSRGTTTVALKEADRRVLVDVKAALAQRPYFFLIACTLDRGGIIPYKPDEFFLARAYVMIDGQQVNGHHKGKWPSPANPFG